MVFCDKCNSKFGNIELYNEHVENLHKAEFDALFIPFTVRYKNAAYAEFELKFGSEEKSKMKTFDQLSDRLKVELLKISKIIVLPSFLSVKLDLTMTKTDPETRVCSFHQIRVQGRSLFVYEKRSVPVDVEAIIQDLRGKYDTRTKDTIGLTLWGFNSVLLGSKTGGNPRHGLCTREKQKIPQLKERRISPYERQLRMMESPLAK
jgi:hypothetical protein